VKKPRIVVVTHGQVSDPFWNIVHHGVQQAAKDADCTAEYRAPEKFDMVSLAQAIDAAVASKPDGLVVSILDADALGASIQRAVSGGIPVIAINSGLAAAKKLGT
jgi:simple sugar transport system substrate-binding protein